MSQTALTNPPVLDIGTLPLQLEDLTKEQIKGLPKPALQELSVLLDQMADAVALAKIQLTSALEDLYGAHIKETLLELGKDTGTIHLSDDALLIKAEIGKRVDWDQAQLAAIAQRLAAAGEDPAEFIEVKYSVSERKYGAWPQALRSQFESARTLKPSKPKFTLTLEDK
ncbi:MAG: hypothetical protein M1579_02080 [Gammaproteobacteria bacterium]|nr:hypothetical protein [Gammaproteobacteria bacterium]